MRSKLLFLIVLIVTFAALPGWVSANLVPGPGFEDVDSSNSPWVEDLDPDLWTGWASAGNRAWKETGGISGAGLALTATGAGGMYAWPDLDGAPADIPIDTAKDYYFALKAKGGSSLDFKIEWHATDGETGAGALPSVLQSFSIGADWTQLQLGPLTPNAAAGFVRFAIINLTSGTTVTIDDAWVDTYLPAGASGVHSPDPEDGEAIPPGLDILRWTRYKGQKGDDLLTTFEICEDCNDGNFELLKETLFVDNDVNSCSLSVDGPPSFGTVTAEHNYAWRVNCEDPNGGNFGSETLVGSIWMFTTINTVPEVDAGPKQALWLPNGGGSVVFQLEPTVSDDDLPVPPGSISFQWTDSGPGTVTYSPAGGATEAPTATMDTSGDYTLTLTVNDGSGPVTDTVLLRVYDYGYTGLAAWYDMEEGNGAAEAHDDYSDPVGANRHHAERVDLVDGVEIVSGAASVNTTFNTTGGHNDASPSNETAGYPGDGNPGGMELNLVDAETGYIRVKTSQGDPNINDWSPGGTSGIRTWVDFEDEVSVSAWVKIAADDFDKAYQSIICNGNTSWRLQQNDTSGSAQFAVSGAATAYGGIDINDGEWHHVMGTYDGTEVALYIDGILDASAAAEGTIGIGNDWLTIGHNLGWLETDVDGDGIRDGDDEVTDSTFVGTIDEVQIYSIGIPYTNDQDGSISVVKIYQDLDGHKNCATYLAGDVDEDCYVDMKDVKAVAEIWLDCNDIGNENCIP